MRFGPDDVVIFVGDTDQFFELLLSLFVARSVGSLSSGLSTPGGIGEAKLNPTNLGCAQLAFIDFGIEFVGASVRALGVLRFCFAAQLRIVGLLCDCVE